MRSTCSSIYERRFRLRPRLTPLLTPVELTEYTLLYRCVHEKRWRKLRSEDFCLLYVDEVGSLDDTALSSHSFASSTYGPCCAWLLDNGLVVLEAPQGRFSLFESEARCKARDHINAWADFARGCWTLSVPQEPGLYFVRPLDHGRQTVRELKRINERLRDTTLGAPVPRVGLVSEWRGHWWLPKLPTLP